MPRIIALSTLVGEYWRHLPHIHYIYIYIYIYTAVERVQFKSFMRPWFHGYMKPWSHTWFELDSFKDNNQVIIIRACARWQRWQPQSYTRTHTHTHTHTHIYIYIYIYTYIYTYQPWSCKRVVKLSHGEKKKQAQCFFNSSSPGQNGRYFADDIFKRIFVNENFSILIKISLKFVPKGPIANNPSLVEIMAWRRIGDKPLSEPMLTQFTDAHMRH